MQAPPRTPRSADIRARPQSLVGRTLSEFAEPLQGTRIWSSEDLPLAGDPGQVRVLSLCGNREDGAPDRQNEDTVTVLAHEIKTPLTAIIGSLKVIEGGALGGVTDDAVPLIEMALRNAYRLHNMINDVLEAEMIPEGGIDARPVDLDRIVRRAIDSCRDLAAERRVDLAVHCADQPVTVIADGDRLERAIRNLVTNAVKFSDLGETVQVRLGAAGDIARLTVSDTGPGIPETFQPAVFEKFAKLDVEDGRNHDGTGLGLHIAKTIVDAHCGAIGFSSEPGDTRFWIDLPIADSEDLTE